MKNFVALAAAVLMTLLLSGCNVVQANTEDLMIPPKLTPEQGEIAAALTRALGTDNFNLKYPVAGEYRSAYVLRNLDTEDGDEAVVFYQLRSENQMRMNILDRTENGRWESVYDIAGNGEDVYSVNFAPISEQGRENLIVSWREQGRSYQNIEVYGYENRTLDNLFSGTGNYIHFLDSNNDGYSEMLLLGWSRSQAPTAQIVRRAGPRVISRDEIQLNANVVDFAGVTVGSTADGRKAIFIDELVGSNTLATEVITVEKFRLTNLMEPPKQEAEEDVPQESLFEETKRPAGLLSMDLDGDGIIEIPVNRPLLGYDSTDEGAISLTTYRSLSQSGLRDSYSTIRNPDLGYSFLLPRSWQDRVTVKRMPQGNQWQFVEWKQELENSTEVLLTIRVTSHQDYQDKFEGDHYFLLAQRGIFEYHASIPTTGHPLLLTEEQVHANFRLISNETSIGG